MTWHMKGHVIIVLVAIAETTILLLYLLSQVSAPSFKSLQSLKWEPLIQSLHKYKAW